METFDNNKVFVFLHMTNDLSYFYHMAGFWKKTETYALVTIQIMIEATGAAVLLSTAAAFVQIMEISNLHYCSSFEQFLHLNNQPSASCLHSHPHAQCTVHEWSCDVCFQTCLYEWRLFLKLN